MFHINSSRKNLLEERKGERGGERGKEREREIDREGERERERKFILCVRECVWVRERKRERERVCVYCYKRIRVPIERIEALYFIDS